MLACPEHRPRLIGLDWRTACLRRTDLAGGLGGGARAGSLPRCFGLLACRRRFVIAGGTVGDLMAGR